MEAINNLVELLGYARETGKYGVKIGYLDDANKTGLDKLGIYFRELNKYFKEIGELASVSWKTFKQTKDRLNSVQPKFEPDSSNILELMGKIKSFRDDLDDNKLAVSKVGGSTIRQEQTYSSIIKLEKS
jgi:hypothetical protein